MMDIIIPSLGTVLREIVSAFQNMFVVETCDCLLFCDKLNTMSISNVQNQ